jgi:hypothetical protein
MFVCHEPRRHFVFAERRHSVDAVFRFCYCGSCKHIKGGEMLGHLYRDLKDLNCLGQRPSRLLAPTEHALSTCGLHAAGAAPDRLLRPRLTLAGPWPCASPPPALHGHVHDAERVACDAATKRRRTSLPTTSTINKLTASCLSASVMAVQCAQPPNQQPATQPQLRQWGACVLTRAAECIGESGVGLMLDEQLGNWRTHGRK